MVEPIEDEDYPDDEWDSNWSDSQSHVPSILEGFFFRLFRYIG